MDEMTLPALGTVTDSTRQQKRRIGRSAVRCSRCMRQIETTHVACFDNGKDAHRSCSELRNSELAKALEEIAEQRRAMETHEAAAQMGFVTPKPSLWTPPTSAPSEELDLSKALILSPAS